MQQPGSGPDPAGSGLVQRKGGLLPSGTRRMLAVSNREQITAYISVNVVSLFTVNTVDETFTVRLNITMAWKASGESDIIGKTETEEVMHLIMGMDDADSAWQPYWYPRWGLRNKVESQEVTENFYTVLVGAQSYTTEEGWVSAVESRLITKEHIWVFRETSMNAVINMSELLSNFPFDLQELVVMVRCEHAASQVLFASMADIPEAVRDAAPEHLALPRKSVVVNFANLMTAEREPYAPLPCAVKLGNDVVNRVRRHKCGAVEIRLPVQRHIGHYLYNVFLIVFVIASCTFAAWSIGHEDVADRLGVDLTLLLTMQAFKLVISDKLPKVDYPTSVDIYILVCFLFIAFAIALHAYTGWGPGFKSARDGHLESLKWVWLGAWLVFNAAFALVCFLVRRKQLARVLNRISRLEFSVLSKEDVSVETDIYEKEIEGHSEATAAEP